jgi:UDP-N-acetyl-2-amino-2-deoxyglucuronate dehydrogenase
MKKHRLAFVGAGRVADIHYASLQSLSQRARLVAFCDTRPEAVAARQRVWGAPGFQSFQDLLGAVETDAVCLFLPHHVHLENVALASQAGKPVLLEKPLAGTLADAQAIADTVARSGIQLFLTHTGLFHPAFQQVLDFVRKGWLGWPVYGRGISAGWLTFRPWDFRLKRSETGGGCWIDAGNHLVYCFREIFGAVERVTGVTARLTRPEMEGEDHAIGVLKYRSGAIAELFVSYGHKLPGYQYDWPQGYLNAIEIYGDQGAIRYVISPVPEISYFSEIPEAMPPGWKGWLTHAPSQPYTYSFQAVMEHFLDCLDTGAVPRVTAQDGLDTLGVLLKLYGESASDPGATK